MKGLETTIVNLFFWKRPPQPNRQGFRTQLESVTRELRLQLGDIQETNPSTELLRDLNAVESAYAGDLRELHKRAGAL